MLNKVMLMGRMVRDPELKQTASGISVCTFSLAVQRSFAKQGEEKQVDYINITAFRQTADFVSKYFIKGQMMVMHGRLMQRQWQDKDGNNRSVLDVITDEVFFCGDKPQQASPTYNAQYQQQDAPPPSRQQPAARPQQQHQSAPPGFYPDYDESELPF